METVDKPKVQTFIPTPDQYAWTFGHVPPVARIRQGELLHVWTEDAFCGRITGPEDLPSRVLTYPFLNPQTGPFYVEGAEPGDTLAIHFVDIEPARDWGVSTTVPLFGALTSTKFSPTLQGPLPERVWIYQVDRQRRVVIYQALDSDYSVELPLTPFHGNERQPDRQTPRRRVDWLGQTCQPSAHRCP